jgi:hypothetical protein
MAGGPLHPSSIYLGGAAGNLSSTVNVPNTNTNTAGALEGIGVVASLGANAPAVLQFNLPEVIPSGTLKLRLLAVANATTGNAKITVADAGTAPAANIGATTLTTDATAQTVAWTTADVLVETKINLTGSGANVANNILTVLLTFITASWTLAQVSVWQPTVVWE